jgi:hypothetical protein
MPLLSGNSPSTVRGGPSDEGSSRFCLVVRKLVLSLRTSVDRFEEVLFVNVGEAETQLKDFSLEKDECAEFTGDKLQKRLADSDLGSYQTRLYWTSRIAHPSLPAVVVLCILPSYTFSQPHTYTTHQRRTSFPRLQFGN